MRKKLILSLLFIAVAIFSAARCEMFSEEPKRPTKTVVVLCDLSDSTKTLRETYSKTLSTIFPVIRLGDAVVVGKITDSSVNDPEVPVNESFPRFTPKDKMGNTIDNPILKRKAEETANEDLNKKKDEIIAKINKVLLPETGKSGKQSNQKKGIIRTDIMSSLHFAEKAFKNHKRDNNVLVILSDMIEDSERYKFPTENLQEKRINEIVNKEKAKGKLPDLQKVKVYIVAPGNMQSDKFLTIQNFWLQYFRDSGANLAKERYGSSLIAFDE